VARTRDIDRVLARLGTFELVGKTYKVEIVPTDGYFRLSRLNKRGKILDMAECGSLRTLIAMALDGEL